MIDVSAQSVWAVSINTLAFALAETLIPYSPLQQTLGRCEKSAAFRFSDHTDQQ